MVMEVVIGGGGGGDGGDDSTGGASGGGGGGADGGGGEGGGGGGSGTWSVPVLMDSYHSRNRPINLSILSWSRCRRAGRKEEGNH